VSAEGSQVYHATQNQKHKVKSTLLRAEEAREELTVEKVSRGVKGWTELSWGHSTNR
jgi:hypothetical protein